MGTRSNMAHGMCVCVCVGGGGGGRAEMLEPPFLVLEMGPKTTKLPYERLHLRDGRVDVLKLSEIADPIGL